jgi:hypothetical protein
VELTEITKNKHFLQIASLLSVAQSAGWRMRHPEMKSVRATLDGLARMIRGGTAAFNASETLKHQFAAELTVLLADIVKQDPKLHYSADDAKWIFETLYSEDAALVFSMLFAVSVSQQKWYSAEQVAEMTGKPAGTWKNRAAAGEIYGVERAGARTWIFPSLELKARGISIPDNMSVEIEE